MMHRKRDCFARAQTRCDCFMLSRTDFENVVMEMYPHIFWELKIWAIKKEKADTFYRQELKYNRHLVLAQVDKETRNNSKKPTGKFSKKSMVFPDGQKSRHNGKA